MKLLQKFVSLFSAAAMLSTAVSLGARAEVSGSENDAPEVITLVADGDASEYGYVHYKYIDENGNEVSKPYPDRDARLSRHPAVQIQHGRPGISPGGKKPGFRGKLLGACRHGYGRIKHDKTGLCVRFIG